MGYFSSGITMSEIRLINRYVSIKKVLSASGYYVNKGNINCIFHNDSKPSMKIYEDENGERAFCFTENKMYFPYDFLVKLGWDIHKVLDILESYGVKFDDVKNEEVDFFKIEIEEGLLFEERLIEVYNLLKEKVKN